MHTSRRKPDKGGPGRWGTKSCTRAVSRARHTPPCATELLWVRRGDVSSPGSRTICGFDFSRTSRGNARSLRWDRHSCLSSRRPVPRFSGKAGPLTCVAHALVCHEVLCVRRGDVPSPEFQTNHRILRGQLRNLTILPTLSKQCRPDGSRDPGLFLPANLDTGLRRHDSAARGTRPRAPWSYCGFDFSRTSRGNARSLRWDRHSEAVIPPARPAF